MFNEKNTDSQNNIYQLQRIASFNFYKTVFQYIVLLLLQNSRTDPYKIRLTYLTFFRLI